LVLPVESSYPVIENPVTVRASAALAAAGAWDTAPTEIACAGFKWMMLFLSYTRGAAGGAVDFQFESSPYAADSLTVQSWFNQAIYGAGTIVAGADTKSIVQQEYQTYTSQGATIENFNFGPIRIEGVERFRLPCKESGVTATPGTAHVVAVLWE
jgi:hypothetical protein